LAAFQRSLDAGIPEVETDVRLTRDGGLVLFHDSHLDEKTDCGGRVEDRPLADVCGAEIGAWFDDHHPDCEAKHAGATVVSVSDLFERFGRRLYYHLEIKGKSPALPERLIAAVRAAGLLSRVTLTSFSRVQLQRARGLDERVPIAWLLRRAKNSASPVRVQRARIATAAELAFDEISLAAEELTPRLVAHAHALGLQVRAWRVRTRDDMKHVLRAGVNGMTLDDPDWLLDHLQSQALAPTVAKATGNPTRPAAERAVP
jgi:glycerophosphoryl diester phosphodiesterase